MELLAPRAEEYGAIPDRRVNQNHGFGAPKLGRIATDLQVQTRRDSLHPGSQLLSKSIELSGPVADRENVQLRFIQGGNDVDVMTIDVHDDVGLVQLEMRPEQVRPQRQVTND